MTGLSGRGALLGSHSQMQSRPLTVARHRAVDVRIWCVKMAAIECAPLTGMFHPVSDFDAPTEAALLSTLGMQPGFFGSQIVNEFFDAVCC
jgi:hypothetical protein